MTCLSVRALIRGASLALALSLAAPAFAQKAIVVVRHAEKVDESTDPLLSAEGKARAESLARALRSLDVKAVYVTQYQRTTLTAAPLMAATGLTPITVPAAQGAEMVARMKQEHPNDVVLAVGHSNTVPAILKLLGVKEPVDIGEEYDNLFIVVPHSSGPPTLLRLKF